MGMLSGMTVMGDVGRFLGRTGLFGRTGRLRPALSIAATGAAGGGVSEKMLKGHVSTIIIMPTSTPNRGPMWLRSFSAADCILVIRLAFKPLNKPAKAGEINKSGRSLFCSVKDSN